MAPCATWKCLLSHHESVVLKNLCYRPLAHLSRVNPGSSVRSWWYKKQSDVAKKKVVLHRVCKSKARCTEFLLLQEDFLDRIRWRSRTSSSVLDKQKTWWWLRSRTNDWVHTGTLCIEELHLAILAYESPINVSRLYMAHSWNEFSFHRFSLHRAQQGHMQEATR